MKYLIYLLITFIALGGIVFAKSHYNDTPTNSLNVVAYDENDEPANAWGLVGKYDVVFLKEIAIKFFTRNTSLVDDYISNNGIKTSCGISHDETRSNRIIKKGRKFPVKNSRYEALQCIYINFEKKIDLSCCSYDPKGSTCDMEGCVPGEWVYPKYEDVIDALKVIVQIKKAEREPDVDL